MRGFFAGLRMAGYGAARAKIPVALGNLRTHEREEHRKKTEGGRKWEVGKKLKAEGKKTPHPAALRDHPLPTVEG